AEKEAAGHNREYARRPEPVGREVDSIGNENTDRDFDRGVVDQSFDTVNNPTCRETDEKTDDYEVSDSTQPIADCGSLMVDHHQNAEFEREQAAGIVYQALAFENVYDPFGQSDSFGDGGGGERIGRSDDRAEHEAEAPVESGKQPGGSGGDS